MYAKKVMLREWTQVRRFARGLLVAVIAHGLAFGVARAQNGCPTPGPHEAILRDHVAGAVISAGFSDDRTDAGVPTPDSGVTRAIVTDAAVCNAIYTRIYRNVDKLWTLPAGADRSAALAGESIHYYRVGDYYAAMLITQPNEVLVLNGWADVMIFDRRTFKFLGVIRA